VKPEKDFTIETMLDRIRQLKDKHGIYYFVIDAWNKLEQKRGGKSGREGHTPQCQGGKGSPSGNRKSSPSPRTCCCKGVTAIHA
jgi:hypothetical protein